MKTPIALLISLFSVTLALACGSSDSGSSTSQCQDAVASSKSAECQSCVKSSCSSQSAAACSSNCSSNASSSDCQNKVIALASCITDTCGSACNSSSTGGGGTSSFGGTTGVGGTASTAGGTSSGGASNGGTSAMPTQPECTKLETCCVLLTAGPKSACDHIAGLNYGPSCTSTYSLYKCDAVIANGSKPKTSACKIDTQCTQLQYLDGFAANCMTGGGMASDTCPADGVTGCCKMGGTNENCTYEGDSSPIVEADCTQSGGVYSATP